MKKFIFLFVFLLLGFSFFLTKAQSWEVQTASGLTVSENPLLIFSAVNKNVCWGIESYDVGWGITNPKFVLTTDGGNNWNVFSTNIPSGTGVEAIYARNAQTAWIAVYDPNTGSNSGIYKTTDSGTSWLRQGSAFIGGGHPAIVYFYNKSDTGICVGTPRNSRFEVYTTTDGGGNWVPVQTANMPTADTGDLFPTDHTGAGNIFLFPTYLRKTYRSTNRGVSWTKINYTAAPSGAGVAIQLKDSLNGLASTYFGDNFNRSAKTTDGGLSWTSFQSSPQQPSFYFLSYVPGTSGKYVVTSHKNIGFPEVTAPGSAYTLNGGDNWYLIDTKPHGPASFSDDGSGWSGGIGDTIYKISSSVLPVELLSFNSIVTGNNIQLSWQTATEINNKGFEIYRNGKKISFIDGKGTTTEKQNYSFADKGLSAGIYNYRLNQIDFDGTQKIVGEKTVNLKLPEHFNLKQNFPNPFNPSTTIDFTIPQSSFINLKVYNVLGEEVATLVNETKASGNYEVNFNAANLSSGIYFYKLQAGSLTESKKMVLLK